MSFDKAIQLLELARMAASRRHGVSLSEVCDRFDCVPRTAQRMISALNRVFPNVDPVLEPDQPKRWRLPSSGLRELMSLRSEEAAALDLAIGMLRSSGHLTTAQDLASLHEKVLALVPAPAVARFETDYEALLEAQGFVARPGPKPIADQSVMEAVTDAIKSCRLLDMVYRSRRDAEPRPRRIAPYGVLTGLRRYIVAHALEDPEADRLRMYRADAITQVSVTQEYFTRPTDFSLAAFAKRAFGAYQTDDEYGEVVWRFTPKAAEQAREFEFHPDQVLEPQEDGSLIVRFAAAGHLEMCWHLYAWGDQVEVLAPEPLRQMCAAHRRGDFPALP